MNVAIPSAAGAATMDLNPIGPRAGADQGNPQVSVREIFKDDSIPLDYPHAGSKRPAIRRGCVEPNWGT